VETDVDAIALRLFQGVMAPLVLGGSLRPGRAIGTATARALGSVASMPPVDPETIARVQRARVRRARLLVPIDDLGPPSAAEWVLAGALHDLLQSMNPQLATFRRGAAGRLVALARRTVDSVGAPRSVRETVSRHAWFARLLEVTRTDTTVSWWSERRVFLGVDPPPRLQAWPGLRRVRVTRSSRRLLELAPLAIDRELAVDVLGRFLARTPLTDLATCTRTEPAFTWASATLALVATRAGRTIGMRALARLPDGEVDAALGRATRDALVKNRHAASPALELLAERAIAEALGHGGMAAGTPPTEEATFARGVGAAAALRILEGPESGWSADDRRKLRGILATWSVTNTGVAALANDERRRLLRILETRPETDGRER